MMAYAPLRMPLTLLRNFKPNKTEFLSYLGIAFNILNTFLYK